MVPSQDYVLQDNKRCYDKILSDWNFRLRSLGFKCILVGLMNTGVDVTAGPWPVYLRSGQSNWSKIGPLGQLIFSGHLGQQLSFLPCHSISTDYRLMKFPDKTLKFNVNHSPKAINSLITQSACVYLDLLPHVKRIWREIYAGNQYFIIQ
jgi:hypothetical protein